MKYSLKIIKHGIYKKLGKDCVATIHVVVTGNTAIVLDRHYSVRILPGMKMSDIKSKLQKKIQNDWDAYILKVSIEDIEDFDDIVNQVQNALNTYINEER